MSWWETLQPWLDAIRLSSGDTVWNGYNPSVARLDMQGSEGPIRLRSISGINEPHFRRTFAACEEYVLDVSFLTHPVQQAMRWMLAAPLLRPEQPPAFPREGAPLPLEARWSLEWRSDTGPMVHTSGESGKGIVGSLVRKRGHKHPTWTLTRYGRKVLFVSCHEPPDKRRVQATFTVLEDDRYTIRVTGDGFFDYWMLDPAHTPAPLLIGGETIEVGCGWGYVRLEHGRETSHGALRRDWGLR